MSSMLKKYQDAEQIRAELAQIQARARNVADWRPCAQPKDGQDFDGFVKAARAVREFGMTVSAANARLSLSEHGREVHRVLQVPRRIGEFFIAKYRARAAESDHRTVATQLRKQGVPLEQALLILLGAQERFVAEYQATL